MIIFRHQVLDLVDLAFVPRLRDLVDLAFVLLPPLAWVEDQRMHLQEITLSLLLPSDTAPLDTVLSVSAPSVSAPSVTV